MGKGNVVPSIVAAEHIGPDDTGDNIEAKRVANYETLDGVTWVRKGTQLATRLDDTSTANTVYIGKAAVGSDEASAVWQISKIDTSVISETWAGSAQFNQIWDNRGSLTYE